MKYVFIFLFNLLLLNSNFGQAPNIESHQVRKNKMYIYWGWNRGAYTHSNITFKGDNYNFQLKSVIAKDRQSKFSFDKYLNPANATIPQYNFRVGYFLRDHWDVSFGIDHMKYVMQAYQTVKITGNIVDSETPYDGSYNNSDIVLSPDFLKFEHTDGLNYINFELRRNDLLWHNKISSLNLFEGMGFGALLPRTNSTLLKNERNDEFHLSGYGLSGVAGLNITLYDVFFVQSELKFGFINMPDIRTTKFTSDRAKQSFFFAQSNIVFGGLIKLGKKKENTITNQ